MKNVVIGKQFESSENYQKFLEIVKEKKLNVMVAKSGDVISFEENLSMRILFPDIDEPISENSLNNNSLVLKLIYKNFSMLFTGDIEEIAEKKILKLYENNDGILKSTVLKVAHHGSKTSSVLDFLNKVRPKYALIGVGENNNFGHPSDITLQSLNSIKCEYFRTDECGEVSIITNGNHVYVKN